MTEHTTADDHNHAVTGLPGSTAVLDPASVLTPAELAAARAVAASAPPFTDRQRDTLTAIFAPTVRALHAQQSGA